MGTLTGRACFLAKLETVGEGGVEDPESDFVASVCTACTPTADLDLTKPQRVLEHMGAHILFDPGVDRLEMPCGLCLRPSNVCQYFLLKGKGSKGNPRVDMERSAGCRRLVNFQWGKAAVSDKNAPCSNVPLFCPLCPKVVWRYNLEYHLKTVHTPDMVVRYADICEIPDDEMDAMEHIWDKRHKRPAKRRKRKGVPALVISEAHTTIDNLPDIVI
jgi:hypothetical protein